jgi:hypothetical protein
MLKTNNYTHLDYLNKCDLISKYSFKNYYNIPKIEKFFFNISLEEILSKVENSKEKKDFNYQIESFFLFSLFLFKSPHLKLKSINKQNDKKNRGILSKNNQESYVLQMRLNCIKQIYALLISIYLEKRDLHLISNSKTKSLNLFKDKIVFAQFFPVTHIQGLNYLYNSELFSLNTKELIVNSFTEIKTKDSNKKIYNLNLLRNLFGVCI